MIIIDSLLDGYEDNQQQNCNLFKRNKSFYESPLTLLYPKVEKEIFYGRNLGYNVLPSIQGIMVFNNALFAAHFDYFFNTSKTLIHKIKMILSIFKYQRSSQWRKETVVEAYEKSTPAFCRVSIN